MPLKLALAFHGNWTRYKPKKSNLGCWHRASQKSLQGWKPKEAEVKSIEKELRGGRVGGGAVFLLFWVGRWDRRNKYFELLPGILQDDNPAYSESGHVDKDGAWESWLKFTLGFSWVNFWNNCSELSSWKVSDLHPNHLISSRCSPPCSALSAHLPVTFDLWPGKQGCRTIPASAHFVHPPYLWDLWEANFVTFFPLSGFIETVCCAC